MLRCCVKNFTPLVKVFYMFLLRWRGASRQGDRAGARGRDDFCARNSG